MIQAATVETIVALYRSQPATAELVALTCGQQIATTSGRLVALVRAGLATRRKFDRFERVPITPAEEFHGVVRKIGKRPYVYELTPAAAHAAAHLSRALDLLAVEEKHHENRNTARNRPDRLAGNA